MRGRGLGWGGLVLIAGLCWMGAARADALPAPQRPKDWDEHPVPTPEVPADDALARRLLPWLALGMAGAAAAAAVKRARTAGWRGARAMKRYPDDERFTVRGDAGEVATARAGWLHGTERRAGERVLDQAVDDLRRAVELDPNPRSTRALDAAMRRYPVVAGASRRSGRGRPAKPYIPTGPNRATTPFLACPGIFPP